MDKYSVHIDLKSEMIFGSGISVPGLVDLEILKDDIGTPYFKGKTFKGKLREEAENIVKNIGCFNKELSEKYNDELKEMFGESDRENILALKFSDCTLEEDLLTYIKYGISKNMFTPDEVLGAMTDIRSFTSIDADGTASKGSLRQFRTINRGFTFICSIYCNEEINPLKLELLAVALSTLRHLGTMESRGKGEVKCCMYKNGNDVTGEYIKSFEKRVRK